ncbi:MAG: hypothetical protein KDJ74_08315, partial [Notoacmeibacter sp.]|nr:hypothetical protein [Notoacmeibacter sp.]
IEHQIPNLRVAGSNPAGITRAILPDSGTFPVHGPFPDTIILTPDRTFPVATAPGNRAFR